jgi:hypothetical protein
MPTLQSQSGVGLLHIGDRKVYGSYRYEFLSDPDADGCHRPGGGELWAVRVSLDDFFALGLRKYQWVRVQFPLDDAAEVCLKAYWAEPPFVWLEFERDL